MPDPTSLPLFTTAPSTQPAPQPPATRRLAGAITSSHPLRPTPAQDPPPFDSFDTSVDAPIDYSAVQALRQAVTEAFQARMPAGTVMSPDEHGDVVRELITDKIAAHSQRVAHIGGHAYSLDTRRALETATWDALFGAGRLQPLLDEPGVENIEAEGYDNVWVQYADGRLVRKPPIAASDLDLIEQLQMMARMSPWGEKEFSHARPTLRMTLPDGSRLAAEAWLTPRPSVTIRKHRYVDTDLEQMYRLGAVDTGIATFLKAAIRAGKTVVISGDPAAGKTTMARAILNELDPEVRIATIEAQRELLLHQMPERHSRVWSVEQKDGGEIGADGRPIGAFPLSRLVEMSLQKNVRVICIGEVVGDEIMSMVEVMQGTAQSSVSTIHAPSAERTIGRMANLITRARGNIAHLEAIRTIAEAVDLVVHLAYVDEHAIGGGVHRFVDGIIALTPSNDAATPVAIAHLWRPGPDGRAAPTGEVPDFLVDLQRVGFDSAWLNPGTAQWATPLQLKYTGTKL